MKPKQSYALLRVYLNVPSLIPSYITFMEILSTIVSLKKSGGWGIKHLTDTLYACNSIFVAAAGQEVHICQYCLPINALDSKISKNFLPQL